MTDTLIRAWKDQDFRATLDGDAQAALSPNPAGSVEDPSDALEHIAGGESTEWLLSLGCCQGFTNACWGLTQGPGGCTGGCMSIWMTTDSVCNPVK